MKTKFNKFERVAGLFVSTAIVGSFVILISVAIQREWFAHKVQFSTVFKNADGIHSGTNVQIAGLHAGTVKEVELQAANEVKVTFTILKKFAGHIRQNSKAQLIRPFIIGERVLEISVGNNEMPVLTENSLLPSNETLDLMSILSDKMLSENIEALTEIINNLKVLVNTFSDKSKIERFVRIADKLEPLVNNLNDMGEELAKLGKQATKHENLATVLENTKTLTNEINSVLPAVKKKAPDFGRDLTTIVSNLAQLTKELNDVLPVIKDKAPDLGRDLIIIVKNLAQLTQDFRVLTPLIVEMSPTLPQTGRRTVELIDESVVLLKALQKSIFLRSNAEEVREEEALRAKKAYEKNRNNSAVPANFKEQ